MRAARDIILVPLREKGAAKKTDLVSRFEAGGSPAGSAGGAAIKPVGGMAGAIKALKRLAGPGDTVLILGSHLAVEEAVARM
jgi:hypothetical protein